MPEVNHLALGVRAVVVARVRLDVCSEVAHCAGGASCVLLHVARRHLEVWLRTGRARLADLICHQRLVGLQALEQLICQYKRTNAHT